MNFSLWFFFSWTETLRKFPIPALNRKCTKDYIIPGTDITVEKGINVIFPTMTLYYDAKYFPQPDKFDPERCFSDHKSGWTSADRTPFFPFGIGPRQCIASRLGKLQAKIGVAKLIFEYYFELDQRHIGNDLKFSSSFIMLIPIGCIHLKVLPRTYANANLM